MKVGITYNLKLKENEAFEEFDASQTIDAICSVFEKNGHRVTRLGSGLEIIERIRKEKVDFVFNIAEGSGGRNREAYVPCLLEMLHVPYSGSDALTLALTLDKAMSKKIALQAYIPTPVYKIVKSYDDLAGAGEDLSYPLITKPAWEGSSKGIYNSSKALNAKELAQNIKGLLEKYPNQPLLVEAYIEGREITVGVVGNDCPEIVGLLEIENKMNPGQDFFYSLEVKRNWKQLVKYRCPAQIEVSLEKKIREYAIRAFREFGCRDFARIDFRISKDNKVFLLELNPLPGLSPQYADLVIMTRSLGMEYEDLILTIFQHALSRYNIGHREKKCVGVHEA